MRGNLVELYQVFLLHTLDEHTNERLLPHVFISPQHSHCEHVSSTPRELVASGARLKPNTPNVQRHFVPVFTHLSCILNFDPLNKVVISMLERLNWIGAVHSTQRNDQSSSKRPFSDSFFHSVHSTTSSPFLSMSRLYDAAKSYRQ